MSVVKPKPIPLTRLSVYPTLDSLNDVVALAESAMPINDPNVIKALLATYHNTLLKELGYVDIN